LIQSGIYVIPIEVKAGENKKAVNFENCIKQKNPQNAICFSKQRICDGWGFYDLPLYLVGKMRELL